jgi:ABC transporter with metal-binding/Fe-S-binding domain ATP-binding protein
VYDRLKVAVLFSGGKDSAFALWCAQMQGWDVESLLTVIPESQESWMFHFPGLTWTKLQAQAMGLPQLTVKTRGEKERELTDLAVGLEQLKKSLGIDTVVSGAVASEYQRTRIDNVCEKLGLKSIAPLWHKNQEQLVREQIESGFQIMVTACNALGLNEEWLGKKLDASDLPRLVALRKKYGLNVAFEGGEAETFVLAAPMFKVPLIVVRSRPRWRGESGYLEMEEVQLGS